MPRQLNKPLPSLVIGLGGSGAVTVNEIKKQLLDLYDNEVPDTVRLAVFDTTRTPMAQFTQGKAKRETGPGGTGYGEVGFEGMELGYLGGNAHDLAQRVRAGAHQEIETWFDAAYYLDKVPHLLNLDEGAGQYRQLGRLAFFRDVLGLTDSQFTNRINGHLGQMRGILGNYYDTADEKSLAVFIVASLAGGTGAGTFIDTAFLVRKIAASMNVSVKIRGFFYLPTAFAATLDPGQIHSANSRAFAALRELSRLAVQEFDKEVGYPIHYHSAQASSNPKVWRAELKDERLYELLYLVDGVRQMNPLNNVRLSDGSAASIADSIMAYMDSETGSYMRDYTANVGQAIANQQAITGAQAYVGSLGAYTMRLPMTQIIEGWGFHLALDVLRILFPAEAETISDTTGAPTALAFDRNQELALRPEEAAFSLFSGRTSLVNAKDPSDSVEPTQLWTQIAQWYETLIEDENQLQQSMGNMSADTWTRLLVPSEGDSRAQMALRKTQAVLNTRVNEKIQLSKEVKEPASEGARRMIRERHKLFDRHLGTPRSNGKRDGGDLRTALDDFVTLQTNRWRHGMQIYVMNHLNGQPENDLDIQRGGKLGWLLAVQYAIEDILKHISGVLKDVALNPQVVGSNRSRVITMMEHAEKIMEDEKNNTRSLPFQDSAAIKAQQAYRIAVADAFDFYRSEITRELVHSVVLDMLAFTQGIIQQLESWQQALVVNAESLYAQMVLGSKQVENERYVASRVVSREILRDADWEEATYQKYVNNENAVETVLKNAHWEAQIGQDVRGNPLLQIKFSINDQNLVHDRKGNWALKNRDALLAYCRSVFDPAFDQESILHYLATARSSPYVDNPQQLAQHLRQRTGELLNFQRGNITHYQSNFLLLAYNDGSNPETNYFVDQVIAALRQSYGFDAEDATRAANKPSDDPFRLMLVSMAEVIPISVVSDYQVCQTAYQAIREAGERKRLHILPSEVQIVRYEMHLSNKNFGLNQQPRIILPRVAMLLEHVQAFQNFLALHAHNVISIVRDNNAGGGERYYYRLALPTQDGQLREWWLTESAADPSLLDALMTFIFRRRDVGQGLSTGQSDFILLLGDEDLQAAMQVLQLKREKDTQIALEKGEYGYNEEMAQLYEERAQQSEGPLLARLMVEYDWLHQLREDLLAEVESLTQKRDSVQDAQQREHLNELRDLNSLSTMLLAEMLEERLHSAKRTAGQRVQTTDSIWL